MTLDHEKRLLQAVVGTACLVPLSAGLWGVALGRWARQRTGSSPGPTSALGK